MASINGSFASPAADASLHAAVTSSSGLFMAIYNNISGWGAVLALFLFAVAYDQCRSLSLLRLLRGEPSFELTPSLV